MGVVVGIAPSFGIMNEDLCPFNISVRLYLVVADISYVKFPFRVIRICYLLWYWSF